MYMPKTTFYLLWRACPPKLAFHGSGPACLPRWLVMVNVGWHGTDPCDHKFSCKWNLSFFKAIPPNRLHFYLDSSLHRISSLFSYFCLFRKAILQKNLKIRFWNFKLIFLRMQFSLVPTFFSLVLVICLSWYLHLKLSHDLLTLVSFNIWRYKFTSGAIYVTLWNPNGLSKRLEYQLIWTGPKYKCKVRSYMDSTKVLLRSRLNLGFSLSHFSFLL